MTSLVPSLTEGARVAACEEEGCALRGARELLQRRQELLGFVALGLQHVVPLHRRNCKYRIRYYRSCISGSGCTYAREDGV